MIQIKSYNQVASLYDEACQISHSFISVRMMSLWTHTIHLMWNLVKSWQSKEIETETDMEVTAWLIFAAWRFAAQCPQGQIARAFVYTQLLQFVIENILGASHIAPLLSDGVLFNDLYPDACAVVIIKIIKKTAVINQEGLLTLAQLQLTSCHITIYILVLCITI